MRGISICNAGTDREPVEGGIPARCRFNEWTHKLQDEIVLARVAACRRSSPLKEDGYRI